MNLIQIQDKQSQLEELLPNKENQLPNLKQIIMKSSLLDEEETNEYIEYIQSRRNNIYQLIIFLILYFIQGLIIGYFFSSLPILIKKNKSSWTSLGILSLSNYSILFNFLIAPLLDKYFIYFIGKRKTYIISTQFIILSILFSQIFLIEEKIRQIDIECLTLVSFSLNFMIGIQNIALDGWQVTGLHQSYYSLGIAFIMIGRNTGNLSSVNLFLYLNDKNLLSNSQFMIILTALNFFMMIITIFSHETKIFQNKKSLRQNYKNLSIFIKNRTLLYILILELTWHFGYNAIESNIHVRLFDNGFDKKIYLYIGLIAIPIQILAALFIGILIRVQNELKIYWSFWILRLIYTLIYFFTVDNVTPYNSDNFSIFGGVIISEVLYRISNYGSIGLSSWINRISPKYIAATFVTTFVMCGHIGNYWTTSFWLFISQYKNFFLIAAIGWIYTVIFILINFKKLNFITKLEKIQILEIEEA